MDDNKNTSTPEEQTAEQEALTKVEEGEIRGKVMSDLNLDEDLDNELIEKLVQREVSQREKLSEAIRQKINWRGKALGQTKDQESKEDDQKGEPQKKELTDEEVKFRAILDDEFLEDSDLPDEIKQEAKSIAKLKSISVKKAVQDPYILHRKQEHEAAAKVQEAGISNTKKGTPVGDQVKAGEVPTFDYTTKEGRANAKAWRKAVQEKGKE